MHSFIERFQTIPDILELDHLTVSGDVTFGKGVTLKVSEVINEQHTTLTRLMATVILTLTYSDFPTNSETLFLLQVLHMARKQLYRITCL